MPTLFILLHVTFIINETFLSNCQNVNAKVLFRLIEEEIKGRKDNNVTVFRELLRQIGSTKPPPSYKEKREAQRKLGSMYNPQFQANQRPTHRGIVEKMLTEQDMERHMDRRLRTEQFKIPGFVSKKLKKGAKKYFRLYLQQLSHCQLSYQWKDLGYAVWPRYIKETYCKRKGCSYRPGMMCQRSEKDMVKVTVLYWTCHFRVRKSEAKSCGWSQVHIKLLSQCICTCDRRD